MWLKQFERLDLQMLMYTSQFAMFMNIQKIQNVYLEIIDVMLKSCQG